LLEKLLGSRFGDESTLKMMQYITIIGGRAYWAGQAVVRPLFVPNSRTLLLALLLFCLQIDVSSISY